jgi:choline dehydrogenase
MQSCDTSSTDTDSECIKKFNDEDVYDFIVVGMGAAGAVVLRYLSDAGFNVLGIEAGNNVDNDPLIYNSTNAPELEELYLYKFFWNQQTAPNPDVDNKSDNYTTGKALGGGTSINGLQYVRSTDRYWQRWADINGEEWGPATVLEGYKALENFVGVDGQYNPKVHGFNGMMQIRQAPVTSTTMAEKFSKALSQATNTNIIPDYNNPKTPIGTFTRWSLFEQPNGNRANSSVNFLQPILNKIMTETYINKLIIEDNVVKGVNVVRHGKSYKFYVNKEVILSCGIYSNEILQRSGIGPAELLESLGIDVAVNNPAVGNNSKNQLINSATFSINPDDYPGTGDDPNALYTGGGFLPSPLSNDLNKRGFQWIGFNGSPDTLSVIFYNLDPQSIGEDRIQLKDPFKVSAVTENLLSNPSDLDNIVAVYQKQITELAKQFLKIDHNYKLLSPTLDIINNTELLKAFIIDQLEHTHHWTGTCTMAPRDSGGVVDNRGRIYGIIGGRVADISVAPIQTDGNTAGPAYFVGWNIVRLLLQEYDSCNK